MSAGRGVLFPIVLDVGVLTIYWERGTDEQKQVLGLSTRLMWDFTSVMYMAKPRNLAFQPGKKMQRTCELSHGGGISFVLGGLGGASDLCGNAPVKELSA